MRAAVGLFCLLINACATLPSFGGACAPYLASGSPTTQSVVNPIPGNVEVWIDGGIDVAVNQDGKSVSSADCSLAASLNAVLSRNSVVSLRRVTTGENGVATKLTILNLVFASNADTFKIAGEFSLVPHVANAFQQQSGALGTSR